MTPSRSRPRRTTTRRLATSGWRIRCARVSTTGQDPTAQREASIRFGVEAERIHVDQGLTGTDRARPGLRGAVAACRAGDVPVVTTLDRLALSPPDARDILDAQASAAVARPTRGNSRLVHRRFVQIERVLTIDELNLVASDVVEAARSALVIGDEQPRQNHAVHR